MASVDLALRDYNINAGKRKLVLGNMGVAYRDLGDLQKAKECFAEAASLQAK